MERAGFIMGNNDFFQHSVTTEKKPWLTAKYFRANKKISPAEADRLRTMGIDIEETEF